LRVQQAGSDLERIVEQSLRQAPPLEAPLMAWPVVCGSAVAERTRAFSPYPLLLLYMSLLQLLRLLLMALLDLLFPCLIGILPLHPLVFLILFPLKLLPFLLLLSKHFLLLLLVFPVFRRCGTLKRREVSWMYRIGRRTFSSRLCMATIGRRIVRPACRLCGYDGAVAKRRRLWSGRFASAPMMAMTPSAGGVRTPRCGESESCACTSFGRSSSTYWFPEDAA
jgi:hypothetical protein